MGELLPGLSGGIDMTKYIDADIFVTHCCNSCIKNGVSCCPTVDSCDYIEDLQAFLVDAPAADVEPVVRGEWIEHYDECECPVCGETWNYCDNDTERFDCCPKCGARLVEHGKERER